MQKNPNTVKPQLPGVAKFPIDDHMVVMEPHLDVGGCIGGDIVCPVHPAEVIVLPFVSTYRPTRKQQKAPEEKYAYPLSSDANSHPAESPNACRRMADW